jgi:hypothetical protein
MIIDFSYSIIFYFTSYSNFFFLYNKSLEICFCLQSMYLIAFRLNYLLYQTTQNCLIAFHGFCFIKKIIRFLLRPNNCLPVYEETKTDGSKIFLFFSAWIKSERHQLIPTRKKQINFSFIFFSLDIVNSFILFFLYQSNIKSFSRFLFFKNKKKYG